MSISNAIQIRAHTKDLSGANRTRPANPVTIDSPRQNGFSGWLFGRRQNHLSKSVGIPGSARLQQRVAHLVFGIWRDGRFDKRQGYEWTANQIASGHETFEASDFWICLPGSTPAEASDGSQQHPSPAFDHRSRIHLKRSGRDFVFLMKVVV